VVKCDLVAFLLLWVGQLSRALFGQGQMNWDILHQGVSKIVYSCFISLCEWQ
jgi:hypothetical protein